jgi:hypothetical protein
MLAVRLQNIDTIKALLTRGADADHNDVFGADVNAQGLISGSEHGLKYGTALEAAELSKQPKVVALLRKARRD